MAGFGRACARNLLLSSFGILPVVVLSNWDISVVSSANAATLRQVTPGCSEAHSYQSTGEQIVEVLLPDGTSLVLGPNSSATVSCGAGGSVSVVLKAGVIRLAGGLANQSQNFVVQTPHGQVVLSNGTAVIAVDGSGTRANLVNGKSLVLTSGGVSREIYRPGFQVTSSGGRPSQPRKMTEAQLLADQRVLNPGLATGQSPYVTGGIGPQPGAEPDEYAETTDSLVPPNTIGFVAELGAEDLQSVNFDPDGNSGDGTGEVVTDDGGTSGGTGEVVTDDGGNESDGIEFAIELDGLTLADNFSVSAGPSVLANLEDGPSTSDGRFVTRYQHIKDDDAGDYYYGGESPPVRSFGPTTVSLFQDKSLELADQSAQSLIRMTSAGPLFYFFADNYYWDGAGYGPDLFGLGSPLEIDRSNSLLTFIQGPFVFNYLERSSVIDEDTFASSYTAFGRYGIDQITKQDPTISVVTTYAGEIIVEFGIGATTKDILAGNPLGGAGEPRSKDNFIFLEVTPKRAFRVNCQDAWPLTCGEVRDEMETRLKDGNLSEAEKEVLRYLSLQGYEDENGYYAGLSVDDYSSDKLIFAAGDLDGLIDAPNSPGHIVDEFNVLVEEFTTARRAFLRDETWTELDQRSSAPFALDTEALTSTPFYVINPAAGQILTTDDVEGETSKILHADFGLVDEGGYQVSTISATIGEVQFSITSDTEADARIFARTVGSSQGLDTNGNTTSSIFVSGPLRSTSAGGGSTNPDFSGTGRLGFFVLENAGTVFDDTKNADGEVTYKGFATQELTGGKERPVGQEDDLTFAVARLGVGESSEDIDAVSRSDSDFNRSVIGFVAGLVESENDDGGPVSLSFLSLPDDEQPELAFTGFDSDANTISARLSLKDGTTIDFGGNNGMSAFSSDREFGMLSVNPNQFGVVGAESGDYPTGSDMAMISGDLVKAGLKDKFKSAGGGSIPVPRDYEHVKWGFFMGDLSDTGKTGERKHVHMGSFAAGRDLTDSEIRRVRDGSRPTVKYSGHMIGNVYDRGRTYTSVGTFKDEFKFSTRTGTITADFDERRFTGTSSTDNFRDYSGSFKTADGKRSGSAKGRFIAPVINDAPAGVVGRFGIQNQGTTADNAYRAVGTFGAER